MCANFTEGKERETGTTLAAKNQIGPVDRELSVLILLQFTGGDCVSFTMMGMYQKTCSLCSPGLEEESVSLCRSCCVLPAGI